VEAATAVMATMTVAGTDKNQLKCSYSNDGLLVVLSNAAHCVNALSGRMIQKLLNTLDTPDLATTKAHNNVSIFLQPHLEIATNFPC